MKPHEFITMLCAIAGTGIAVVGIVAYLLTWVTDDIKELKEDMDGLTTEVTAVDGRVAKLEETVAAVDGRVAKLEETVTAVDRRVANLGGAVAGVNGRVTAVRNNVERFKTVVEEHAELLATVSSRQPGAFLTIKPGQERALTYYQPWGLQSPEANEADALWAPYLEQLRQGGYDIETVTPSPFSPLQ